MITTLSSMPYGHAKPCISGHKHPHSQILKVTGRNTGNLLFHYAASLLTAEPTFFIERSTTPKIHRFLNRNSKALIIPVANLLNEEIPVSTALTKVISACECPVLVLGLGLQAPKDKSVDSIDLPQKTIEFLRILSEKSALVSCRGQKTLRLCSKYTDISSFRAHGCPSILISPDTSLGQTLQANLNSYNDLVAQGLCPRTVYTVGNIVKFLSRAGLDHGSANSAKFEQLVMLEAIKNPNKRIIFQTEPFLFKALDMTDAGHSVPAEMILEKFGLPHFSYSCDMDSLSIRSLPSRLLYFSSAKEWISSLDGASFAVSQRIHGTIAALNAGVPAVCVYHDARTEELCQIMGVPSADINSLLPKMQSNGIDEAIANAIQKCDFNMINKARKLYATDLVAEFGRLGVQPSELIHSIANS